MYFILFNISHMYRFCRDTWYSKTNCCQ